MGEGPSVDARDIQTHEVLPNRRAFRTRLANASRSRFDQRQHRRRCARSTRREFARFLYIALGSASEYEYHLLLAFDLGFIEKSEYVRFEASAIEVKRMLTGFIKKLTSDV